MQVSFTNWCFIINIWIIPYAFPALLITYQNIIQNLFSILIETYFDQKFPWNFLQSSMELFEQHLNNTRGSMEFHGTWAAKPQVPWNSMEFHGILSRSKVPWNSMELFSYSRVPWNSMELLIFPQKVPWNSMEFHGTFLNFINFIYKKNHISKYCFWYLIDDYMLFG